MSLNRPSIINPPSCELDKILNSTIAACDPLDGKTDGVVSRSDLCKLNFNLNSTIGMAYSCAATTSTSLGLGFGNKAKRQSTTTTPAQNGTVSAKGVAVAQNDPQWSEGFAGSSGILALLAGAEFEDAATAYDSTTGTWELSIAGTGGEWVGRFLELQDVDNLSTLDNVTYDTLVQWMTLGMKMYADSSKQTTRISLHSTTAVGRSFIFTANPILPSQQALQFTTTSQSAALCIQI